MANLYARFVGQPLWLVGFRPFFILAFMSGLALPVLWALLFSGRIALPGQGLNLLQWHAHEMYFGFGWAVMGGFLLTASKNWVGVRGYHGAPLFLLVLAWGVERLALWQAGLWPTWAFVLASHAFLATLVCMLVWTLLRYRRHDSYRDNLIFLVLLPAFIVAKAMILHPDHFADGTLMTLALFRLAFLVMLERTLTQFMRNGLQIEILRHPLPDGAIKALALVLVATPWLPGLAVSIGEGLLAALLLCRFCFWHPWKAVRRIELGVMYFGYLAIVLHLLFSLIDRQLIPLGVGRLVPHIFGFGVMGMIIPAMLIRIVKGHTGRKVVFEAWDKAVLYLMLLAFALRIGMTQWLTANYLLWIALAAVCWFLAFAILAWRYTPFLLRARVDGREH